MKKSKWKKNHKRKLKEEKEEEKLQKNEFHCDHVWRNRNWAKKKMSEQFLWRILEQSELTYAAQNREKKSLEKSNLTIEKILNAISNALNWEKIKLRSYDFNNNENDLRAHWDLIDKAKITRELREIMWRD